MNAAEKRNEVVRKVKSREGKNSYTQSSLRENVGSGYSDCSSLQQWAYHGIGMEIGSYTGAQIGQGEWVTKGEAYPDASRLLPGDEIFFATNYDNGRPYNVGHIEMYVGNGQISGHGSGIGPTRKNMKDYCCQRNNAGKPYIGVKRYIKDDGSAIPPATEPDKVKVSFVGECTGDDVNVRKGPGSSYAVLNNWPKLNKTNLVDVLEKIGSWYLVRIAGTYQGYVYAQYIRNEGSAATTPEITDAKKSLIADGQIHGKNFTGYAVTVDGDRGSDTRKLAAKVLQTGINLDYAAGLAVDGDVQSKTKSALRGHFVKKGETQYMVTVLEIMLMLSGYDPNGVECPGGFGSGLEAATKLFQKDHSMPETGIATYDTFLELLK